jgi:hypothetical protein
MSGGRRGEEEGECSLEWGDGNFIFGLKYCIHDV